jgi:hypothetical protein
MRLSDINQTRLLVVLSLTLASFTCRAQLPGSGSMTGINAAFMKLFGDATAFEASANVRVLDQAGKETMTMPMDFTVLDRKVRVRIDMNQMKSTDTTDVDMLKKIGIARMSSVIRPDKKEIYLVYPDQKSYFSMPMSPEEAAENSNPKVQKTPIGKETIEGHECVKNKVVVTDEKGQSMEATTWNAKDLKDFPVQIQAKEKDTTSIVRFKTVKFNKADPKEFDPPADYSRYNDASEMIQAILKKTSGGAAK